MRVWWERYPGVLDFEREQLRAAGIPYSRDEHAFTVEKRLVIRANPVVAGTQVPLTCVFPDSYPFFRPEVFALDLSLPRHQNPFEKNLCLLPDATLGQVMPWNVHDTLASLLLNQLPKVFGTRGTPQAPTLHLPHDEVVQGEPYSAYLAPLNSFVLFDGSASVPPSATRGRLDIAISARNEDIPPEFVDVLISARRAPAPPQYLGALLEVTDEKSVVVASAPAGLRRWARSMKRISIPWTRVSGGSDPGEFLAATHALPLFDFGWHRVGHHDIALSAALIREEIASAKHADGWLFRMTAKKTIDSRGAPAVLGWSIRSDRAGENDLLERIPELRFMRECTVGVVGLGGIGAPSTLEFARSGVRRLHLLDGDFVEAATSVRWPRGFSIAGLAKPLALANILAADYPYTEVRQFHHRIGTAPRAVDGAQSELEVLSDFFAGLDLVYDASGDMAVENFVSTVAREMNIPVVRVSTTNGAWGGLIARFRTGAQDPCSHCLLNRIADKSIPLPAESPTSHIQPSGCRSATFTGPSVDVAEVALNGVRMALSMLSEARGGGYPAAIDDVLVMNLRDPSTGQLIWPAASAWHHLEVHPNCEQHA